MYLEKVDTYAEAYKILENSEYDGYVFKEEHLELKNKKPIYLPDGFKSILLGNSTLAKSARNYVKKGALIFIKLQNPVGVMVLKINISGTL